MELRTEGRRLGGRGSEGMNQRMPGAPREIRVRGSCPLRPKNPRNHSSLSDIWGDSSQRLATRMDGEKETNDVSRWPPSDPWFAGRKGPR